MTDREFWIKAWSENRAKHIAAYLGISAFYTGRTDNADYRMKRRDSRRQALHYSRLIRSLKNAT